MPSSIAKGTSVEVLQEADLISNPCIQIIGAIVVEWSLVEASVATYYVRLACGPEKGGVASKSHWIALETFESIQGQYQRLAAFLGAMTRLELSETLIGKAKDLFKRAMDLSRMRNNSAHGRWMKSPSFPDALVFLKNAARSEDALLYTRSELHDFRKKVSDLGYDWEVFFSGQVDPPLAALYP